LVAVSSAYSQDVRLSDCVSGRTDFPTCQVFNASNSYLSALGKKDWNALSQLGVETRSNSWWSQFGGNLSLKEFQHLLDNFEIQTFSYLIHDIIIINPYEAETRYSLRLRANSKLGNIGIDLPEVSRTILWTKVCSNCPQPNSRWLIRLDGVPQAELSATFDRAKTPPERRFVLLGSETSALEELIKSKQESGISLLDRSEMEQAFAELRQANFVANQLNDREQLSAQLDVETAEERIARIPNASDPRLRGLFEDAGQAYAVLKQFDKALERLTKSVTLIDPREPARLTDTYNEIANVHLSRGDRTEAINWFRKGYEACISSASDFKPDSWEQSTLTDALLALLLLYELEGRHTAAADLIRNATSKITDPEFRGGLLYFYGLIQWMRGDVTSAVAFNEQALEMFSKTTRDTQEREQELFTMAFMLSMIYSGQGDYKDAARNLRIARAHFGSAAEDDEDEGIPEDLIKMVEGVFYASQGFEVGELARLQNLFAKASKNIAGEITVADLLDFKGIEFLQRSEDEKGLSCWLTGVEFAEELGDQPVLARLHNHVAGYYHSRKQYAKALEHYRESMRFSAEPGGPHIMLLNQMQVTTDLVAIGQVQSEQEHYGDATATYQRLLNGKQMLSLFSSQVHQQLAEVYYAQKKYDAALDQLRQGVDVALTSGNRVDLWELYQLIGRVQWTRGEYALAQSNEDKAIAEIERIRRNVVGGDLVLKGFFEDKLPPYHDMIALMVSKRNSEGALVYAERSKSRVMLDALKHGRQNAEMFMSQTEREQEVALRTVLISLNRRISGEDRTETLGTELEGLRALRAAARLDYEIFKANLYVNHPEMLTDQNSEQFGLSTVKSIWPKDDTALLEFAVTDDDSYLFAITSKRDAPDGAPDVQVYDLEIGKTQLAEKISHFKLRLSNPEGPIERPAEQLYELLVRKAEPQLLGKKNLIIVPDGPLWELPFEALKPSKAHFLLDERVITYAPSLAALQEMHRRRNELADQRKPEGIKAPKNSQQLRTLLIIANPSVLDESQQLPATQALAQKLLNQLGRSRVEMLVGPDASEDRAKTALEQHQIIHFATHGVLDNERPLYSYLLLAQQNKTGRSQSPAAQTTMPIPDLRRDGLLEAWELMDLGLSARLVVLSGCDTARGHVANGEGVVGMTWALFMAGAPATVVSQWRVESESTNQMMFYFYQNLLQEPELAMNVGPAEALQRAAIRLKETREYAHPYYWAGFVFIGDGAH
jgi:CHAT domain-containing protein